MRKTVWGFLFVLAAIFLLFVGFFTIGFGSFLFRIALGFGLIAIFIRGLRRINFPEILLPLAGLGILFRPELRMLFGPWFLGSPLVLLGAAILASVGLSILFRRSYFPFQWGQWNNDNWDEPRERPNWESYGGDPEKNADENDGGNAEGFDNSYKGDDGSRVYCRSTFSSVTKYVTSDNFEYAMLESTFGYMKVFFDNAAIKGGNATVELSVSFGGAELYVPKEWTVDNKADTTFGGLDEKKKKKNRTHATGSQVLTLVGSVTFGGVTIIYV